MTVRGRPSVSVAHLVLKKSRLLACEQLGTYKHAAAPAAGWRNNRGEKTHPQSGPHRGPLERNVQVRNKAPNQKGASKMALRHRENHRTERVGWLRAAVLGANDGLVSTASLVLGVTAAHGTHSSVLVAGVAGLVAGAMAMAAGEYVSVHSQADIEKADLDRERKELKADDQGEHKELAAIYVGRGLDSSLASQVAQQLMEHDALGAHARDELGISPAMSARPIQAALASAASFAVGAGLPLLVTALVPFASLSYLVSATSLVFLAILGGLAAHAGGAGIAVGATRVTFWGALAMGVTAGVGAIFGTVA